MTRSSACVTETAHSIFVFCFNLFSVEQWDTKPRPSVDILGSPSRVTFDKHEQNANAFCLLSTLPGKNSSKPLHVNEAAYLYHAASLANAPSTDVMMFHHYSSISIHDLHFATLS